MVQTRPAEGAINADPDRDAILTDRAGTAIDALNDDGPATAGANWTKAAVILNPGGGSTRL